jgi:hypothetical protein
MDNLLSAQTSDVVATKADRILQMSPRIAQEDLRKMWQDSIDETLEKWIQEPDCFDDEYPRPSRSTIEAASRFARILFENRKASPTRIITDANGGIVFEREEGALSMSFHLSPSRVVEFRVFENAKLRHRDSLGVIDP